MAEIELKNATKSYGQTRALDDLSIKVNDKEFFVLFGPAGAGKTATLRMIAGLEKVTEGEIYVEDKRIDNLLPKDRNI